MVRPTGRHARRGLPGVHHEGRSGVRTLALLTWFHGRQLLRIPFFAHQCVSSALVFEVLRTLGLSGFGRAVPHDLWLVAGIAGVWSTTTLAVGIIGFQRFQGTLEHMAISTLPPGIVFGSLASAAALIGLVGFPLTLAAQFVTGGHPTVTGGSVVVIAACVIACSASASVLAAVFVVLRGATVYESLIVTPVWLASGVVIPLGALPDWIVPVAYLFPITSAVSAADQPDLMTTVAFSFLTAATSAVWFVAAGIAMRAAVRRATISGTLGLS
ncbi:hypothetical protein DEJ31_14395 [Curtobacterium sp. MCPF17_031]|nr:hypothetical protein DEJ31_14395 [Curtobacterium sp. MCPF17_031]